MGDTVTVFVAVVNQFKIDTTANIQIAHEVRGLRPAIENGFIIFKPVYTGKFELVLKTNNGLRRVMVISKVVPPPTALPSNK